MHAGQVERSGKLAGARSEALLPSDAVTDDARSAGYAPVLDAMVTVGTPWVAGRLLLVWVLLVTATLPGLLGLV